MHGLMKSFSRWSNHSPLSPDEVIRASAKTGIGINDLLAAIIDRIPPPQGDPDKVLQALIFDSHYDSYRGVITYVRIIDGTVTKGQKIRFLKTGVTHEVLDLGQFVPQRRSCDQLTAGQVGYLVCNIKDVEHVHIGDTLTVPGKDGAHCRCWLQTATTNGLLWPLSI